MLTRRGPDWRHQHRGVHYDDQRRSDWFGLDRVRRGVGDYFGHGARGE
jgi:hypothetical protein